MLGSTGLRHRLVAVQHLSLTGAIFVDRCIHDVTLHNLTDLAVCWPYCLPCE